MINLARIDDKYIILDAGCGPGKSTKLLTYFAPQRDTIIYAFDFSSNMINLCEKEFKEYAEFNLNPQNHWERINNDNDQLININNDNSELRKYKSGKIVKFFSGIVEKLNFENDQFDLYISNLCLQLCQDYEKAIEEAYRVLKPNGVITFTVWGKESESKLFSSIFTEVFTRYNLDTSFDKRSYRLGKMSQC